jgi:hypothetical protein
MAGLVPATHTHRYRQAGRGADEIRPAIASFLGGRDKPGHDGEGKRVERPAQGGIP